MNLNKKSVLKMRLIILSLTMPMLVFIWLVSDLLIENILIYESLGAINSFSVAGGLNIISIPIVLAVFSTVFIIGLIRFIFTHDLFGTRFWNMALLIVGIIGGIIGIAFNSAISTKIANNNYVLCDKLTHVTLKHTSKTYAKSEQLCHQLESE